MRPATAIAPIARPAMDAAEIARLTRARLKELDRLRDVAFLQVEKLADACEALPREQVFSALLANAGGQVMDFERLARSIRQIMVLEFELRGLFQAPDRDAPRKLRLVKSDRPGFEPPEVENLSDPGDLFDPGDLEPLEDLEGFLDIRSDYRTGPLDQVVAGIRKTIGAEAPENDPFAPPPERQAAPAKLPPATVKLPQKQPSPDLSLAQRQAAVKAAAVAIRAKGGNGFRKPSKKAIAKARAARHRGQGPPR
jgi:hypothetical protein